MTDDATSHDVNASQPETGSRIQTKAVFTVCGVPNTFMAGGDLCTVIRRTGRQHITAQDPTNHGAHLRGYEGRPGETIIFTVRIA